MKPKRWEIIGIGLLSAVVIMGCASMQGEKKLYDRLGGLPTIRLIVDDFVGRVGSDTRINRFFKDSNVALVKERFTHLFCELSGGPCTYLGADMKNSHSGMGISNADFDAVIEDATATLDKFKVSGREKDEFLALLRPMRKDTVEKP
jgi:hemoglobin